MKLKHAATFAAGGTPSTDDPANWDDSDEGIPWVSITDMSSTSLVLETRRRLSTAGARSRGLVPSAPGTVLFAMYASVGAVSTLAVPATWNQAILGITPRSSRADSRFLAYWLRHLAPDLRAITRTSTQDNLNADQVANLPFRPIDVGEQRRIADFLDDQTARIDNIIAARRQQADYLEAAKLNAACDALRGAHVPGPRRSSGLSWLGDIPEYWPTATVQAGFEVVLGKMLDEKQITGAHLVPYLRNTNVQWDRIDIDDLKVMDIAPAEVARFTVEPGDLLICEGGQPGRSSIWRGQLRPLGFQKALHRARPRGENDNRWLQVFLRAAVGMSVFSNEFGQATIGHLTGEQLKAARLPMPSGKTQVELLAQFDCRLSEVDRAMLNISRSAELLEELKRSLITAVVSGGFDVSAADGSRVLV